MSHFVEFKVRLPYISTPKPEKTNTITTPNLNNYVRPAEESNQPQQPVQQISTGTGCSSCGRRR